MRLLFLFLLLVINPAFGQPGHSPVPTTTDPTFIDCTPFINTFVPPTQSVLNDESLLLDNYFDINEVDTDDARDVKEAILANYNSTITKNPNAFLLKALPYVKSAWNGDFLVGEDRENHQAVFIHRDGRAWTSQKKDLEFIALSKSKQLVTVEINEPGKPEVWINDKKVRIISFIPLKDGGSYSIVLENGPDIAYQVATGAIYLDNEQVTPLVLGDRITGKVR